MKWILGLSRYPVFQPQNTPNTRKRILSPIMPCFRGFGVFRGSLIFGDKSQYMVAAPSSRVGRGESEGKSRVRLIVFSPDVANCRQTVDALLAPLPPLGSGWLRETTQRKKGYFFRRRLAANPPKPNSVPITIMLGSGTTASEL
jgi:hypothetical protein